MTVTTTNLTRAAGLSAVVAGLLFCAVQIAHPPVNLALVTTTEWQVRQSMKVALAALSLVGITGIYLRQVKKTGVLGLIGYLVFAVNYLMDAPHEGGTARILTNADWTLAGAASEGGPSRGGCAPLPARERRSPSMFEWFPSTRPPTSPRCPDVGAACGST